MISMNNRYALGKASAGGGGAKQRFLLTLPETGESGVLYYVNTGRTREGYTIWQEFIWVNNAWAASGAFDSSIDPSGLMYQRSWDPTTATLVTSTSN